MVDMLQHYLFVFCLQAATVFLSDNGLKITVEDSKYVQASAFVQSSLFQDFQFQEENAVFKINLAVMLVGFLF